MIFYVNFKTLSGLIKSAFFLCMNIVSHWVFLPVLRQWTQSKFEGRLSDVYCDGSEKPTINNNSNSQPCAHVSYIRIF